MLPGSGPQLLEPALRATHHPVDQESVGVGRYLRSDPDGQPDEGSGQRPAKMEILFKFEKAISMCCLALRRLSPAWSEAGFRPRPTPLATARYGKRGLQAVCARPRPTVSPRPKVPLPG